MKKLNMFNRLPKEDQTFILDLCDRLPYRLVVEKLAQPRDQGGLSLTTSESSLSKFVTRHHPETIAIQATGQYAAAVQVSHQAHGEANFEAILGLVQNRILDSLRNGKSIADLDKDFRSLARVQKCFLADLQYRHKNDHVTDAYLNHVKDVARAGDDAEFVRNDIENDPGAGQSTINDFEEELTQYDLDIEAARVLPLGEVSPTTTFLRGGARIVAAQKLSDWQRAYIAQQTGKPASLTVSQHDAISSANPAQLLAMMKANAATKPAATPATVPFPPQPESCDSSETPSEISNSNNPKTPAISHLSPNFASPETAHH